MYDAKSHDVNYIQIIISLTDTPNNLHMTQGNYITSWVSLQKLE